MSHELQALVVETGRVITDALSRADGADDFAAFGPKWSSLGAATNGPTSAPSVVDQWLATAIDRAGAWPELVERLAATVAELNWVVSYPELPSTPELEAFRQHYSWSPLVGPADEVGGRPVIVSDDLLIGFTLQAPHVSYPHHHHAPPELYGVISGPLEWQIGDGPWVTKEPGDVIVHRSSESHAMRTGDDVALTWAMWPEGFGAGATMPAFDPSFNPE